MAAELTEAGRKARAAYLREYRKRRKEQIKDNQIRHWNKVGAQMEAEKSAAKNRQADETKSGGSANAGGVSDE